MWWRESLNPAHGTRAGASVLAILLWANPLWAASATPVSFRFPVSVAISGAGDSLHRPFSQNSLVTGDFNGDRNVDFVVGLTGSGSVGSGLLLFLGRGDGSFQVPVQVVVPSTAFNLLAGDWNRDNKADLAFITLEGDGAPTLNILFGNGDGSFQSPVVLPLKIPSIGGFTSGFIPPIFSADVNRDGAPDLLVLGNVFLNDGHGAFRLGPSPIPGIIVQVADLNRDDNPDLLVYNNAITVWYGKPDGSFSPGPLTNLVYTPYTIGDLDLDGYIDFISSTPALNPTRPGSTVSVAFGSGNGGAGPAIALTAAGSPLAIADLNRDGFPDILSGNSILLGKGNREFYPSVPLVAPSLTCQIRPGSPCQSTALLAVADLNGDGLPDLIYAWSQLSGDLINTSYDLSIYVYINDSPGSGLLNTGVVAPTGTSPVATQSIVSAYGVGLAAVTETSVFGNDTLGGIRVHVGEQLAKLFYVSPSQINFALPPSVLPWYNFPSISIEHVGKQYVAEGLVVATTRVAPAFFSANGSDLALATAVRILPTGDRQNVPVFSCMGESCKPIPIDLSTGDVYLTLYGTGFSGFPTRDQFGMANRMDCGLPVTFSGSQGQFPGLDQLNLYLPPSSLPHGTVYLRCTFSYNDFGPVTVSTNVITLVVL